MGRINLDRGGRNNNVLYRMMLLLRDIKRLKILWKWNHIRTSQQKMKREHMEVTNNLRSMEKISPKVVWTQNNISINWEANENQPHSKPPSWWDTSVKDEAVIVRTQMPDKKARPSQSHVGSQRGSLHPSITCWNVKFKHTTKRSHGYKASYPNSYPSHSAFQKWHSHT